MSRLLDEGYFDTDLPVEYAGEHGVFFGPVELGKDAWMQRPRTVEQIYGDVMDLWLLKESL